MLKAILKWLGFNKPADSTVERVAPTFTGSNVPVISKKVIQGKPYGGVVHTEESLAELTKGQLKTLGETMFQVKFNSGDRKAEMIMRIITAQGS